MKDSAPRKFRDRWRIAWTDADGKRVFATFDKKGDAQRELDARKAEADRIRAGVQARAPEARRFTELCDYWLTHRAAVKRSGKDDESIINSRLRPFFGALNVGEISIQRVDRYRAASRQPNVVVVPDPKKPGATKRVEQKVLSDKTLHNHLTLLIAMLNLAVELEWLATAPRIKKPKLVEQDYHWLKSEDDIRALLARAVPHGPGVMELYAMRRRCVESDASHAAMNRARAPVLATFSATTCHSPSRSGSSTGCVRSEAKDFPYAVTRSCSGSVSISKRPGLPRVAASAKAALSPRGMSNPRSDHSNRVVAVDLIDPTFPRRAGQTPPVRAAFNVATAAACSAGWSASGSEGS
ncbi:MAG: hypothetical protein EXR71_18760 [Myxococcales bacterium]|nr:hypothetical protein [Myxococcales bacterium]